MIHVLLLMFLFTYRPKTVISQKWLVLECAVCDGNSVGCGCFLVLWIYGLFKVIPILLFSVFVYIKVQNNNIPRTAIVT